MKYEFASAPWFAALHGIIAFRATTDTIVRPNWAWSICEVFYDAPMHLANAEGKVAWACFVNGADVDFELHERDNVLLKVVAHYGSIISSVRLLTEGDPQRLAHLAKIDADLQAAGKLKIVGTRASSPGTFSLLHDVIARLTL